MPLAVPFPKLLLRKRLWIGVCVLALVGGLVFYTRLDELSDDEVTASPLPEFHWIPLVNLSRLDHCRNSEQGHVLMVDELGYVCSLSDVMPSGCCSQNPDVSTRYDCSGCLSNGCCAVYEYCISCCLHPDKQPLLLSILTRSTESYHPLFSSVRDQFELCLAKCRTSSQSVQHENTYRNPKAKHCYGTDAPTLLPEIKQEDH